MDRQGTMGHAWLLGKINQSASVHVSRPYNHLSGLSIYAKNKPSAIKQSDHFLNCVIGKGGGTSGVWGGGGGCRWSKKKNYTSLKWS